MRIGPFKFELLNKEPSVGLVHDLISNATVEEVKHDAKHTLKATPYSTGSGAYVSYSRWRTSKVTYFNEILNENAQKMSKNVELVTKCILSKDKYDSENYQVSILLQGVPGQSGRN